MAQPPERIQKVLANHGLASRREIERWIDAGRIKVNGKLAKLGDCYSPGDQLVVDGKPFTIKQAGRKKILGLMYYKPEGEVSTRRDEKGRATIFDNLPDCGEGRWVNVGRLDLNTSGLMLFTNSGELANRLMHPKYRMAREYAVRVLGDISAEQINAMLAGVTLEDGTAKFETIHDAGGRGSNHWYHVTLREGRNREVRRLWESQGIMVSRLIRIRFGQVKLDPKLKSGDLRELNESELNQLLNEVGLPLIKSKKSGHKRAQDSVLVRKSPHPRGSKRSKPKARGPYRRHTK